MPILGEIRGTKKGLTGKFTLKPFNLNFVLFITCTLQLTALPSAFAQGDTTAGESTDQSIPAELRVSYQTYYLGEIEAVIEAAQKAGRIKGYSHVPADHAFFKGHKGGENPLKPTAKAAIENGEADAVVFGKWWCWQFGEGEKSAINLTAKWGAENNPNFRLLWQTHWALLSNEKLKRRGDVIIQKENYLAPDVLKPRYDKAHKELEAKVDWVNKQQGRQAVVIIPVANAVLELRSMVVEGKFPGVSKQSELFITEKWSGHRHIRMLTAYCNFAVLFGVSPEGLSPSVDHLKYKAKGGPLYSMAGITAEQDKILQKLAWETVSNYPYAGIAKHEDSHPRKHGRTDYWLLHTHEEPNNATWTAVEVFGPADTSEPRLKGGGYSWTPDQVHGGGRGLNDPFIGTVVVAGDTVFVAGTQGGLMAYAAADGNVLALGRK